MPRDPVYTLPLNVAVVPVKNAGFGSGVVRPIHLDDVISTGSEASIVNCTHNTVNNCDRSGVICGFSFFGK